MPNHFHLVLWTKKGQGNQLSDKLAGCRSPTPGVITLIIIHPAQAMCIKEGRFKAFPVQADGWGRHSARCAAMWNVSPCGPSSAAVRKMALVGALAAGTWGRAAKETPHIGAEGLGMKLRRWLQFVNGPARQPTLSTAIGHSVARGRPLGSCVGRPKARELDLAAPSPPAAGQENRQKKIALPLPLLLRTRMRTTLRASALRSKCSHLTI